VSLPAAPLAVSWKLAAPADIAAPGTNAMQLKAKPHVAYSQFHFLNPASPSLVHGFPLSIGKAPPWSNSEKIDLTNCHLKTNF
jgi:hypothetical protein